MITRVLQRAVARQIVGPGSANAVVRSSVRLISTRATTTRNVCARYVSLANRIHFTAVSSSHSVRYSARALFV